MNHSVTVRIPEDLQSQLEQIARKSKVSISELIRESLRRWIISHRFRQLRGKVLPFAEAQGILTDEDVFRIVS